MPEPDSPTRPRVRPAATVKETPSTAWTAPAEGVEGDPQIVDAQQGLVRFEKLIRFGDGLHGQFLTLGSTTAYSRSMTTLAATMKKAASSVTPSTTGWSERCRAS